MVSRIFRLPAVLAASGKSKSAHYDDICKGLYVRPIKIGSRAAGYPENEVAALQAARIAGKSDAEISALVSKLMAAREATGA